MGICSGLIRPSDSTNLPRRIHTYPRHCTVKIKGKDFAPNAGTPYDFILTDPIHLRLDPIFVNSLEIIASQCILPGIDPHGAYYKKCQDYCLILSNPNALFLALFDGHGVEGSEVVNFCSIYAERFFSSYSTQSYVMPTQTNPEQFLLDLTETCAYDLSKMENQIDSSYSGT